MCAYLTTTKCTFFPQHTHTPCGVTGGSSPPSAEPCGCVRGHSRTISTFSTRRSVREDFLPSLVAHPSWWARLNTAEIRGHTNHDRPHWGRSSACRVPPDGWLSSIDLETSAEIPRLCSVHGLPHTRDSSRRANTQTISRPFKFDQPPCSSPASPPSPPLPLPNPDFIRNFGMSTAISARIGCDLTEI